MSSRNRLKLKLFFPSPAARELTGWRRWAEVILRRLGLSWRVAPIRRLLQVLCLGLYFFLFFYVCWPYAQAFSNQVFPRKESLPVEIFLWLDPLVGLSTALAARCWNVAVIGMAIILLAGFIFPRGFCGYLCPLGTLIDLFDFLCGRHLKKFHSRNPSRWSNLRFYLLGAIITGALFGVLLSGFLCAIPILTRGLLFSAGALQLGLLKNWSMVPPYTPAVIVSLVLFASIFLLATLGPRFWCRSLCPSGALLSLAGFWKIFHREVDATCINCGQCVQVCPFDAINPDFSTRVLSCTACQACAGVCPQQAISFVCGKGQNPLPGTLTARPLSRRAMLGSGAAGALLALATPVLAAPRKPLRPPGSVPESQFLDLCIRCGECIKVCPGPVLQAPGLEYGLEALWTPIAWFQHAGCHQACNFCTLVCPTQAIRPLDLPAKQKFRIGLAKIDAHTCLPHRGERDCQLCFDECQAAGYNAIEMRPVALPVGPVPDGAFSSSELEDMSRIQAPFIKPDLCNGCGLCEYRCHSANVCQRHLLPKTAIKISPL